jgi:hypothetical protein
MFNRSVSLGLGVLASILGVAGLTGCACCGTGSKALSAEPRTEQAVVAPCLVDFVGVRGADGLTGPAGMQGPLGLMGAQGVILIGPRGAMGPAGPDGIQGVTGPMGPSGAVLAGGPGVIGRTGPAGAQGSSGAIGAQGASADGFAGPTGAAGPAGAQGAIGQVGAQGPTLVGPAGPAGHVGLAGVQGSTGDIGATGVTTAGIAGPVGPTGPAGAQGATGSTGAAGVVGIVPCWVSYRAYWFDAGKSDIRTNDAAMAADVASYLNKNPSLQLGLDGYADSKNPNLSHDRVAAVRDALIQAGVPSEKIKTGAFGDAKNRQDRRVEVLINTAN